MTDVYMSDIYATPESDLAESRSSECSGASIDDAITGNVEVHRLGTLGATLAD